MITPSYGLTATERVLPSFVLDWTTGLAQDAVDVTRAGVATYIDSSGVLQIAAENTQRVDYSTGIAGLLVEESRRNAIVYSNKFDETVWDKRSGGTGSIPVLTPNYAISPDGTLNAWRFQCDRGAGNTLSDESFMRQRCFLDGGASPANPHDTSISIWAKSNTGVNQTVYFRNATGSGASTIVVTPEWKRFSISSSVAATVEFFNIGSRGTFGNNVVDISIFGSQLEFNIFPTSYIPTEASAVTRNADVATVTGTNFSDWYNIDQGTIICEFQANADPATVATNILTVGDGTSNNRQQHYLSTLTPFILYRTAKAGAANNISFTGYSATTNPLRTAYSYSDDRLASALNGGSVSTITQDPPDVVDRMYVGGAFAGQVAGSMTMRKILYYPYQITDAELQAFSKQG